LVQVLPLAPALAQAWRQALAWVPEQARELAPQVQPRVQRQARAWVPAQAQVVLPLALGQVVQQRLA
jgi:hypothetical protein